MQEMYREELKFYKLFWMTHQPLNNWKNTFFVLHCTRLDFYRQTFKPRFLNCYAYYDKNEMFYWSYMNYCYFFAFILEHLLITTMFQYSYFCFTWPNPSSHFQCFILQIVPSVNVLIYSYDRMLFFLKYFCLILNNGKQSISMQIVFVFPKMCILLFFSFSGFLDGYNYL